MQYGLGINQINMLAFIHRQDQIKKDRGRYSIARDHITRNTAIRLENRELIYLVRDCCECWLISLTESGKRYCQDNRLDTMPIKF